MPMNNADIPVVTVVYNTPDLLQGLLASLRRFYPDNPVHVVDGSDATHAPAVAAVVERFDHVRLHAMGYNIHHGPGMAWAVQNLGLTGPVLFLDTDIAIIRAGFLEELLGALRPGDYGAGGVAYVDQDGFDVPYAYGAIAYLHPPCMLCDVDVMRQWPLPTKHGAPMFEAMRALHRAGRSDLLRGLEWASNDVRMGTKKVYVDHFGKGTSQATGSYNLDEWLAEVSARRAARSHAARSGAGLNPELLSMIPVGARRIVEVGCSTGVLARAVKDRSPSVHYRGIEIDPVAAELAQAHCDVVTAGDIEAFGDEEWAALADRDCWVFGDVLEHLREPWQVLRRIRRQLPADGSVVVCVPNAQHWSLQAKLATGDFRYTDGGLHDRTHLRWFTRTTLLEMFDEAGFVMQAGLARTFHEPQREAVIPAIRAMAAAMGQNADQAVADALPLQYVIRAVPRVAAQQLAA